MLTNNSDFSIRDKLSPESKAQTSSISDIGPPQSEFRVTLAQDSVQMPKRVPSGNSATQFDFHLAGALDFGRSEL